jgi:AAA15 family ATPase/GTPase
MNLEDYFDFTIANDQLYAFGEVEEGYTHGIEVFEGEYYATLFHIQKSIAKGELKKFLEKFDGTSELAVLGNELRTYYPTPEIKVKYKGQSYPINKYSFSSVLDYYIRTINQSVLSGDAPSATIENSINAIGFENFRRFEKLELMELNDINFFVGQNNSGKSTVIKALSLLTNYLNQDDLSIFKLTQPGLDRTNIVTFERALNRSAVLKGENEIVIEAFLKDFHVKLSLTGKEFDSSLNVNSLIVHLGEFEVTLRFVENVVLVSIKPSSSQESDPVLIAFEDIYQNMLSFLHQLNDELEANSKLSMSEKLKLIDDKNRLEREISRLTTTKKTGDVDEKLILEQTIDLAVFKQREFTSIIDEAVNLYIKEYNVKKKRIGNESIRQMVQSIKVSNRTLFERSLEFYNLTKNIRIHHIGTNNGSQHSVLLIRDQENPLARIAHEFYQLKIQEDSTSETMAFIRRWLTNFNEEDIEIGFGVAEDLHIIPLGGEGYSIRLLNGKLFELLADKGMGTQQIVLLVLSMAVLIEKYTRTKSSSAPIIMVEEPEINLHPRLEAMLALFFLEISKQYGFKFIIETHSEYIIRKSQLLGLKRGFFSEQQLTTNPFKVYYFDKTTGPYEMKYTNEGRFDKDFGEGFYDVVDDLALKIFLEKNNIKR